MDDLNVENVAYNVIPVTEYDPFEAKFAASLYWLVFRATVDGTFEDIPSQVTSPVQRDSEKRITVRPEVTEFLTNGEIYCKVFNSIFHAEDPVVGQWAILHGLSRHGFYVVEEGDLAVTDSALQQKRPFRKSTHLALMDCLMNAYSSQVVTVEQVVASVSKFSSFNASKELPFDLEDAVLLWINKVCSALNEDQHKKQRQHAEQLLQNQDKAKRFRFRRDQLQPKVQTMFPVIDELLKDISDGQSLLGILMFYHPSVIKLEDIRFGNDLSTKDSIHNLDLFRSLCSQFICTSVLALKLEDLLYGSLAMKPNVVALLSEMFYKCEEEILSENGMDEIQTSKSDLHLKCLSANKENLMDNGSSSVPTLSSGERIENSEYDDSRDVTKARSERSSSLSGQFVNSDLYNVGDQGKYKRSRSESHMIANRQSEFKSPFQLDFTADPDFQQPLQNTPTPKQVLETEKNKKKENPFSGIFQRPVLAGESRKCSLPNMLGGGGSPRTTPRQESPLLLRRTKQKQRTLDLEEWDMQQEEVEELHLRDAQRSQSLTGLDKARLEPRQSFHAWQENTGASLSDTNLASSRIEKISLDFKPDSSKSAPQREGEGVYASVRSSNLRPSSKSQEEHVSQDSLSSSPKTTDNQLIRTSGNFKMETKESFVSGPRDSCRSDISAKELSQFEEIEAMVLAGRSVETPRRFVKASKTSSSDNAQEDEDELDTSVSSDDMSKFRLEVLQRLTEDKLRQIPDGAEMEDDDDPILLARNNAVSSPRNPQQCTRLEVQENAPNSVSVDPLSPITETTEPFSSAASIRNSVSSPNSTAPSSPCSPLDVAPFMPEFFTTSPANTLDRQKQRGSSVSKEEGDRTVIADLSDPTLCQTPRNQRGKTADNSPKSRSFEQLARGSYTVGHVSVESAKAAGIPVITELTSEEFGRMTDSRTSSSDDVFGDRKFSAKSSQSSRDLSGIRELFLTSASVESKEIPVETNRRDSLDCTPPQSPSLTRDQETRESIDHRHSSSITIGSLRALDSPGDVVIYERASLSSASHVNEQDSAVRDRGGHAVDHAPGGGKTVIRPKKSDAFVFDFNQHAVNEYHGADAPDYRTYRKGSKQIPQVTQGKDSVEPIRRGLGEEPNSIDHASNLVDGQSQQRTSDQHRTGENHEFVVDADVPDAKTRRFQVSGAKTTALDVRRSDGFTTYRKGAAPTTTDELLAQFSEPSIKADRFHTIVKSSTSQGGMRYGDTAVQRHSSHAQSSHERDISVRPFPSSGGEGRCVDSSGRKGADEGDIPVSGSSNIVRSRTFRKKPDGQIIDEDVRNSSTSGYDGETPSTQNAIDVSGQQTTVTHVRGSPEGAGCEHPQRISWSDDSGSQDTRHLRQIQAERTSDVITPVSPRRTGSPRQTGRGSPGARISWLTAAKSGVGGQVILNEKGEIEECKAEQLEEEQVMTSQLAYLRMQLDEKRRHIEAEKFRAQEQWEDQRRRLGQTAFWYVIGKAQGEPEFGEETGNRVVHSDRPSLSVSRFENKLHKAEPELPDQPSPPIAWSSPASSPLPASAVKSSAHAQLFETREYRLSEYPPIDAAANVVRPSSEPAADLAPGPTTPARPSSHEPEAVHYTVSSPRKCWDTSGANLPTPPPFVRRGTAEAKKDIALDHPVASHEGGEAPSEIEVDEPTPCKKGLAMFIGDNTSNQCMTPEIEKKRDRFLRLRQKKQEEERLRKEAELEKKKRKEEKQREKEMLQKMEEERLRVEELERQNAEREWKARQAAEVQPARVPDTYATYRAGPRKQVYEVDDDASNYFVLGPTQSSTTQSGFAEFSGPQCYVKPSGKSNRKIIVNAVSHVCLSGTVNQEQKDKCLQAVSESDGHHFMILFKDGLKFRGLYVHSLDNDQLHKIFGIGPRVVTNKMIEGLYKYNSGGKEFVKIHSKTVSISVDGFAIQKSYWQSGKPSVQSKTSSNLKRPPRQPQR